MKALGAFTSVLSSRGIQGALSLKTYTSAKKLAVAKLLQIGGYEKGCEEKDGSEETGVRVRISRGGARVLEGVVQSSRRVVGGGEVRREGRLLIENKRIVLENLLNFTGNDLKEMGEKDEVGCSVFPLGIRYRVTQKKVSHIMKLVA